MLAMLKLILGITDDSQDDYLSNLLVEAQGYVENYLDRCLDLQAYEDYVTINNRSSINLRQYPVKSVDLIENLCGFQVSNFKVVKPTGIVRLNTVVDGDFVVNYEAGYETLPSWAMKAIVDTAVSLKVVNGSVGSSFSGSTGAIKKETIFGVAEVTYDISSGSTQMFSVGGNDGSVGALPFSVVQMLEPHKNRYA